MVYCLPVVKIGRKKYFVDERLKQLRNVKNPHDYLDVDDDVLLALRLFG